MNNSIIQFKINSERKCNDKEIIKKIYFYDKYFTNKIKFFALLIINY